MSADTSITVRRATVADAGTLSSLAARTFAESFGRCYPPPDLQTFLDEAYSVDRQQTILAHPDYAIWLLEHTSIDACGTSRTHAVGHAAAGPCGLPHADVAAGDGELKRLYLLKDVQNGGHGARLFATALDWLQRAGPRTLWIGVWSENPGAQRFYARHGFKRVGEYEFAVGRVRDREFILRRDPLPSPT